MDDDGIWSKVHIGSNQFPLLELFSVTEPLPWLIILCAEGFRQLPCCPSDYLCSSRSCLPPSLTSAVLPIHPSLHPFIPSPLPRLLLYISPSSLPPPARLSSFVTALIETQSSCPPPQIPPGTLSTTLTFALDTLTPRLNFPSLALSTHPPAPPVLCDLAQSGTDHS